MTSPNGAELRAQAPRRRPRADRGGRAGHGRDAADDRDRARPRPERLDAGGAARQFPRPAGRVLFVGAEDCARPRRRARRRLRPALPDDVCSAPPAAGRRPGRARVRARRRARSPRSARPARGHDRPADDAARRGARASRSSPRPDPRPRRARRRRRRGMFVTFLSDFGLQDDFVGTCHGVIKRIAPDVQIIDITHGIPPAPSCRARSCSRTRCRTCPRASTSPWSIPASAVRGARSRCATVTAGSTSAPTTACCFPPRSGRRARGGARDRQPRVRARARLAHVPRARHLRARRRAPRARVSRSPSSVRRSTQARLRRLELPTPELGRTASRRPSSTSTRSGTCS